MNKPIPNKYFRDHTGKKYGLMTVISFDHYEKRSSYWLCECECGNRKVANVHNLKTGQANSCGCLKSKCRIGKGLHYIKTKSGYTTHSKTDEYRLWSRIKFRCYNTNYQYFHLYGGRGIKVCDEWINNPVLFIDWAKANGYKKGLIIDRIDNDGDYEPNNCRFVNDKESSRNTRRNIFAEICGVNKLFIEWCEDFGLNYKSIYHTYIHLAGLTPTEAIKKSILIPERRNFVSEESFIKAISNLTLYESQVLSSFAPTSRNFFTSNDNDK